MRLLRLQLRLVVRRVQMRMRWLRLRGRQLDRRCCREEAARRRRHVWLVVRLVMLVDRWLLRVRLLVHRCRRVVDRLLRLVLRLVRRRRLEVRVSRRWLVLQARLQVRL